MISVEIKSWHLSIMTRSSVQGPQERDAVHTLPLSIIPLKTRGLKEARLVKNAALQGVVELFSDMESGSGQIHPDNLGQFFDFAGERGDDLAIIESLSVLPSYDVYSLRLELRDLGISIADNDQLKLSDEKARELAIYMSVFTRPLFSMVYDDGAAESKSYGDLLRLFHNPNNSVAIQNLRDLADALGISLIEIPQFLERYGDVYLSLAYYASMLDQVAKPIENLAQTIALIRDDRRYKGAPKIVAACDLIEDRLMSATADIGRILNLFEGKTQDMWRNISAFEYRKMESLIIGCQKEVAGNLCALVVKMDAWKRLSGKGSLTNSVQFLMSDMIRGVEKMPELSIWDDLTGDSDKEIQWVA